MKVNESFAVKATPEVRKDKRFKWYVNWLKSLDNRQSWVGGFRDLIYYGIDITFVCGDFSNKERHQELLTLDEVYSRYGKEIYEANGIDNGDYDCNDRQEEIDSIKQPFQESREYDGIPENIWNAYIKCEDALGELLEEVKSFKSNHSNESILKQIAEHKAKIEELEKKLR